MTITLTSTQATLTAQTVNGPVTVPINPNAPMPKPLRRIHYAAHYAVRPRFVSIAEGVQQLTF